MLTQIKQEELQWQSILSQISQRKHCTPRSDLVWSGPTLFAIPHASLGRIPAMSTQLLLLFLGQLG